MFGSRRKAEAGSAYAGTAAGRAGFDALTGRGVAVSLLAGGAGTPCSSSFQPTAASIRMQQQAAMGQPGSPQPSTKAAEAERKRAIEAAAAKRCASGKVFPGTHYRLDMTIGKGSYGRVKRATDLRTGEQLAIKFLAKDLMTKQAHWIRVRREINLLTLTHHPHIIKVHEWLEASEDVLIVMDYVPGKDLFDRINEKPEKRYNEEEARAIFRQMVSALDYCHQNRIVHRDLKPENVMIDGDGQVRLIDFGFANLFHPRDHLTTNCGSPLYAAPEIVQAKPYVGPEVDIWSLGIVLYAMLVGALPFEDENLKGLYKKIGEGRFTFPEHVSPQARDLINSMLQVSTLTRASMAQVRLHPWVNLGEVVIPDNYMPDRPLHIPCPREDLIRMLPQYGYDKPVEALRQLVMFQPDSPAFAGYCLLEEKATREMSEMACEPVNVPGAMRIQHGMSHYGHLEQPMASSLKEYRPMVPVMESGWQADCAAAYSPRYSVALDTSLPLSSLPCTPVKQQQHAHLVHPSVSGTPATTAHSNIMAQAAATVVNKFRKFRDMRFGLGTTGTASGSPRGSRRDSNVMHL